MKSEDSNGKVGIEVGSKKMIVKNTAEVRDSNIREVEVTRQEHKGRENRSVS